MDSTYRDLWDEGERIYPAPADSVAVFPGKNRLRLTWQIKGDPNVTSTRIYWNYDADSAIVPVSITDKVNYFSADLNNMAEAPYSFTVYTYDSKGNRSIPVSAVGRVYGDTYGKTLLNKLIKSASFDSDALTIEWGVGDAGSPGARLTYTNKDGETKTLFIDTKEELTVLSDFDMNNPVFEYSTIYLPDPLAIDTFYTETLQIKARGLITYSRAGWTAEASSWDTRTGSSNRPPSYTLDGNMATAWVNGISPTQYQYPHWILIDMLEPHEINAVTMTFATVRNETPKSIEVYGGDSPDEMTLLGSYAVMNQANIVQYFEFENVTVRYFKINATAASGSTANIYVPEIGAILQIK